MTTATGIHSHPTRKLGLRPNSKPQSELLQIKFKARATPRATVDNITGTTFGMYDNDRYGDCGPTALCNFRRISSRIETGHQHNVTLRKCLQLYSQSSTPPFDPSTGNNDNGVMNPDLLYAARHYGVGDERMAAYGQVQVNSDNDLALTIDVFGGALVAVNLQLAQQSQTEQGYWDYSPSGEWGGHDIVFAAYDLHAGSFDCVSWAERVRTTSGFRVQQVDEVWVPIFPETLKADKFNSAVDTAAFADDFQQLTGQSLADARG